jgi:translation initiation factor 2 gamma subunit (eIF-2gamma)
VIKATKGYAQRRFNVCMECENYKPTFFGGSCKLCGCAVRVKITLASQDCPIDKWKKIDVRIS